LKASRAEDALGRVAAARPASAITAICDHLRPDRRIMSPDCAAVVEMHMPTSVVSTVSAEQTRQVFEHHLGAFAHGLDAVLSDYAEDSVLITPDATYRGLAEIRGFFRPFVEGVQSEFWDAFQIHARAVAGEIAYLVWSSEPAVAMATDTLLVCDGKIAVHTFTPFKR
jgi:hypothetical protein